MEESSLIVMYQWRFALGFITGAAWSITNYLFLINLLNIALLRKSKAKLFLILIMKFPVLYLIGFLILISKFFPFFSLLIGAGSILLVVGGINIWPKRK